jgi:hypothetical protein
LRFKQKNKSSRKWEDRSKDWSDGSTSQTPPKISGKHQKQRDRCGMVSPSESAEETGPDDLIFGFLTSTSTRECTSVVLYFLVLVICYGRLS